MLKVLHGQLPRLSDLIDDTGAKPRQLARALGVHERTVYRWIEADNAPRAAMLALFFASRWGRSLIAAEAEHSARLYAGFARCLLEQQGARLVPIGREGANSARWARFSVRAEVR